MHLTAGYYLRDKSFFMALVEVVTCEPAGAAPGKLCMFFGLGPKKFDRPTEEADRRQELAESTSQDSTTYHGKQEE